MLDQDKCRQIHEHKYLFPIKQMGMQSRANKEDKYSALTKLQDFYYPIKSFELINDLSI